MSLKVKQETSYKGKDWWQWAVWIDGAANELNEISSVVYTLHPTFPTPVRRISNRKSNFRLDSAGWGEFEIYADIVHVDGHVSKYKHWLKLEYPPSTRQKSGMPKADGDAERRPVLFLSSTLADANVAGTLRRILSKNDIKVVPPDEASSALLTPKMLESLIADADIAVFLISGRPSLWMSREIEMTLAQEVKMVVPILVGKGTELPSLLNDFQPVCVMSPEELAPVARRIIEAWLPRG